MNPSTEWADSPEQPGYKTKVIKHGNCTIHLFRPELNKIEKEKREAHIKAVAGSTLANYYKRKEEEKQCL